MTKPFYVIDELISPQACEHLVSKLSIITPSIDINGNPIKYEQFLKDEESQFIQTSLFEYYKDIENHFKNSIENIEFLFQEYYENPEFPAEMHRCENSKYYRKKWTKVKDIDLVGYLWLKDFNNGIPLDLNTEIYGGKLEFPTFNFSLLPHRGTIVFFPAGPGFLSAISPILIGTLEQIKIGIKLKNILEVSCDGNYQDWFL